MIDQDLAGLVAFVTGAGAGIGAACAAELVARGAQVMVADIDAEQAEMVATDLGEAAAWVEVDVRDAASVDAAVGAVADRWGRLDIAINNAGVGVPVPRRLHEWTDAEWRRVLDVNLDGAFHCARAELALMLQNDPGASSGRGSIVMMGSIGSVSGLPTAATYVTSKHGLLGMTRSIAVDYATLGIRANLLAPGYVDTDISPRSDEQKAALGAMHPLGRMASPPEIASVACYLASPAASFVTGACWTADGGYTTW